MTAAGTRRDRSEIPRDWWRVLARAFIEVLLVAFACLFFDRVYVAALTFGLTVLVLVEVARLWIRNRTSVRDALRLTGAWLIGGLLGFVVVWYLTLMPDF